MVTYHGIPVMCVCVRACVCACVLVCVRACVRTCVRACVRARITDQQARSTHSRPCTQVHGSVSVRDPGQIPIRWTCSAALSTGEFSPAAMVFSMGCVLYELTTHGLQPFTSYDATNAEDFDTKVSGSEACHQSV